MPAARRKRVTKAMLVQRFYRRAMKGIRYMRRRSNRDIDGIELVFLHEHNMADAEGDRIANAAELVGQRLRGEGFFVHLDARDIEQLGGQHMECISHVGLIIRKREPREFVRQNIVEC